MPIFPGDEEESDGAKSGGGAGGDTATTSPRESPTDENLAAHPMQPPSLHATRLNSACRFPAQAPRQDVTPLLSLLHATDVPREERRARLKAVVSGPCNVKTLVVCLSRFQHFYPFESSTVAFVLEALLQYHPEELAAVHAIYLVNHLLSYPSKPLQDDICRFLHRLCAYLIRQEDACSLKRARAIAAKLLALVLQRREPGTPSDPHELGSTRTRGATGQTAASNNSRRHQHHYSHHNHRLHHCQHQRVNQRPRRHDSAPMQDICHDHRTIAASGSISLAEQHDRSAPGRQSVAAVEPPPRTIRGNELLHATAAGGKQSQRTSRGSSLIANRVTNSNNQQHTQSFQGIEQKIVVLPAPDDNDDDDNVRRSNTNYDNDEGEDRVRPRWSNVQRQQQQQLITPFSLPAGATAEQEDFATWQHLRMWLLRLWSEFPCVIQSRSEAADALLAWLDDDHETLLDKQAILCLLEVLLSGKTAVTAVVGKGGSARWAELIVRKLLARLKDTASAATAAAAAATASTTTPAATAATPAGAVVGKCKGYDVPNNISSSSRSSSVNDSFADTHVSTTTTNNNRSRGCSGGNHKTPVELCCVSSASAASSSATSCSSCMSPYSSTCDSQQQQHNLQQYYHHHSSDVKHCLWALTPTQLKDSIFQIVGGLCRENFLQLFERVVESVGPPLAYPHVFSTANHGTTNRSGSGTRSDKRVKQQQSPQLLLPPAHSSLFLSRPLSLPPVAQLSSSPLAGTGTRAPPAVVAAVLMQPVGCSGGNCSSSGRVCCKYPPNCPPNFLLVLHLILAGAVFQSLWQQQQLQHHNRTDYSNHQNNFPTSTAGAGGHLKTGGHPTLLLPAAKKDEQRQKSLVTSLLKIITAKISKPACATDGIALLDFVLYTGPEPLASKRGADVLLRAIQPDLHRQLALWRATGGVPSAAVRRLNRCYAECVAVVNRPAGIGDFWISDQEPQVLPPAAPRKKKRKKAFKEFEVMDDPLAANAETAPDEPESAPAAAQAVLRPNPAVSPCCNNRMKNLIAFDFHSTMTGPVHEILAGPAPAKTGPSLAPEKTGPVPAPSESLLAQRGDQTTAPPPPQLRMPNSSKPATATTTPLGASNSAVEAPLPLQPVFRNNSSLDKSPPTTPAAGRRKPSIVRQEPITIQADEWPAAPLPLVRRAIAEVVQQTFHQQARKLPPVARQQQQPGPLKPSSAAAVVGKANIPTAPAPTNPFLRRSVSQCPTYPRRSHPPVAAQRFERPPPVEALLELPLRTMESRQIRLGTPAVGLKNMGTNCYLNSFLQVLFLCDAFVANCFRFKLPTPASASADCSNIQLFHQLQLLFYRMLVAQRSSIHVKNLFYCLPDFYTNSGQQDSSEVARYILTALGGTDGNLVRLIWGGEQEQKVMCRRCRTVSRTREPFVDICLPVPKEGVQKTLQTLLDHLCVEEALEGSNQYACDQCRRRTDAVRCWRVRSPPTHLMLVLNRFSWDRRCGRRRKEKTHVQINARLSVSGLPYSLFAAVMHRGDTAESGHYYTLGRRSETPTQWLELNDSRISPCRLGAEEINARSGDPRTDDRPYMVFYRCDWAPPAPPCLVPTTLIKAASKSATAPAAPGG